MWGPQGWKTWGVQPAMFNDVPHEQIDWAELAKQWIQMQHTPSVESGPPPLPPPLPSQAPPPSSLPPPPGHLPPGTEMYPESPLSKVLKASPETFHDSVSYESKPEFTQKASNSPYWKPEWDSGPPGDVDHRLWAAPPMESNPPLIGGKETFDYGHMHDNAPLAMQSIDYNHMSDYSYNQVYSGPPPPPPSNQYDQYWSQVNSSPSTISPMFIKKERSSNLHVEEEGSHLDAAKRKTLPAWIREGLEKMEQERLRKMEKEKSVKKTPFEEEQEEIVVKEDAPTSPAPIIRSKFESESEDESEPEAEEKKIVPEIKREPSPVEDTLTEEEKKQEKMLRIRYIMTDMLLSVTNSEMYSVAQEIYKKEKSKAPARQLATTTSLTSLASGLSGLASYGTESEASEEEAGSASDSEEELYHRIKEKKRLFAATEKKILAELERKETAQKVEVDKFKSEHTKSSVDKEASNIYKNNSEESGGNENSESIAPSLVTNDSIPADSSSSNNVGNKDTMKSESNSKENKSVSSDSSSSSSDSGSDTEKKKKKKKLKDVRKSRDESKKSSKKSKSPSKHGSHHRRSRSRESSNSEVLKISDKKSNKKKKKCKRSHSNSSSDSTSHHRKHSDKYYNHRERRSHSHDDRDYKYKHSSSPTKSHRKSDSYSYRPSHSSRYDEDKYERKYRDREEKYYYSTKRSPSPHSYYKLPKKYRTSRSPSSENDRWSGKKLKKSRNH